MISPAPKTKTVTVLPGGHALQVAPGQMAAKVIPADAAALAAVGIYRWQAVGDGTFRPVIRVHAAHASLPDAAIAFGIDRVTLWRLWLAGFVAGRKVSPKAIQIDLASLSEHLDAVEADPDFWTDARIKKFAQVL